MTIFDILKKAIIAGMFISLGCIVNLKVGGNLGAFLFSFGLFSVVLYGVPLFTGKAGFCESIKDIKHLPLVLLGNILGTLIFGTCTHFCFPSLVDKAGVILSSRMDTPAYTALFASILCGFVMTTIVRFTRKQAQKEGDERRFLLLILGIPLFILSGYWHSIADAFYYICAMTFDFNLLWLYPVTVIGNYIGCNLYNIITHNSVIVST
jgi:formate/nitrite transporter FocA (FNT family)